MIPVQADRRLKKSKPSYQRTNSQTFKMFDEAQIKEFKEIFGFLDQDGNGVIEVDDLVALHGIMGKPADAVKALLCNRGVKADRLTEAEVAQMFDQVKPA